MISVHEILNIHEILIENFGGTQGVRDMDGLISALHRPFQTFDKSELYPSTISKAASLIESIISNHPFIDGNKRTGYVVMRLFLLNNNLDIKASENERFEFVMNIASGKIALDEIIDWLEKNT